MNVDQRPANERPGHNGQKKKHGSQGSQKEDDNLEKIPLGNVGHSFKASRETIGPGNKAPTKTIGEKGIGMILELFKAVLLNIPYHTRLKIIVHKFSDPPSQKSRK